MAKLQPDTTFATTLSGYVSLFASSSTLLCCALPALLVAALPALLVAIGAGATLAGLVSTFPALIWLSNHKEETFSFSAAMLLLSGWLQWKNRSAPCPIDPQLAAQCMQTRMISRRIYFFSISIFFVGVLFAFVLPLFNEQT
jgi:uncharacterized membrane protein